MDYVAVIRQAWQVTRRSRVLRGLGAISAAQLAVYSLAIGVMLVPLTLLPRLTTSLSAATQGTVPGVDPLGSPGAQLIIDLGQAIVSYMPLIVAGSVGLLGLWVVLGVLDVAAQAGMIAEVDGVLTSRTADLRERMRAGFRMWWRVAYLSAVAAMPTLLMLLVMGIATTYTYTIPLLRGGLPNPAAAAGGQLALVPLQGIASLATTVLAVVVQIALRSAVLENLQWRESLQRGFGLVRANLVHVALTYLIATAIATVLASVLALVAAAAIGVVAVVLISASAASPAVLGPLAIGVAVVGVIALTAAGVVVYSLFIAWMAAVWTILWKQLRAATGADLAPALVRENTTMGTE